MDARSLHVVVAPDEFGGTLSAVEAAHAIADGWLSARPGDRVRLIPQSDGGPGFVAVLAAADIVETTTVTVAGPLGASVDAAVGVAADGTVYLETAQACGLGLLGVRPDPSTAVAATTRGVGMLLSHALTSGASRIVVGLGGSATTDGGRGALDELGGLAQARARFRGVELTVASDVDNPLLGPAGAAAVFGPQKGADEATVELLEARLEEWARELGTADEPGAGAAGGLGAALLAVGGTRRSGAELVAEATGRREALAAADVIVTGEGRYDAQTARGKVIAALAAHAGGTPVIVLAGQVDSDPGIEGVTMVRSLVDAAGSLDRALADASTILRYVARRAAAEFDQSRGVMRE
ncbi:hypothetical protein nbrc107696_38340 [Gordonia spumicola]|uniref:Glycerate kinase n=1 Tax=Gordonia spumicola TaxID=589161 RepID=A0A7I9VDF3_9ACTN|nr:glycerate kinase [Gordonia spumicola]GEE03388.1 hypothetical protein nbrc107696_38340 [Gordonia spumicola]